MSIFALSFLFFSLMWGCFFKVDSRHHNDSAEPREDLEALRTDMEEPGRRWTPALGSDGVWGTFPHFSEPQFVPLSCGGKRTHGAVWLLY